MVPTPPSCSPDPAMWHEECGAAVRVTCADRNSVGFATSQNRSTRLCEIRLSLALVKNLPFRAAFEDEMFSAALCYQLHLYILVRAIDRSSHPSLIITNIIIPGPVMSALVESMNMHANRRGKIDSNNDARARNLALARPAGSECRREVYSPKRY